MTREPGRLTDEELGAYADHAITSADVPLASLVLELMAWRVNARRAGIAGPGELRREREPNA